MSLIFDLHTHSIASDGALTPEQLIKKAKAAGIDTLALTDHDTVEGLTDAQTAANKHELNFINGIELSTKWNDKPIHVVGLNIRANDEAMLDAAKKLKILRNERAIKIGEKLEKAGIKKAYANARRIAADGTVTRQHFSQFLVEAGYAKDQKDVFKRYLVRNKPGYVSVAWPGLEETIDHINNAGGVAVIAHPLRYKITATKLRNMIEDFKALGGKAIEVVTGNNDRNEIETLTNYAKRFSIAASVGSDYHNDDMPWIKLGKLSTLSKDITPVWELW